MCKKSFLFSLMLVLVFASVSFAGPVSCGSGIAKTLCEAVVNVTIVPLDPVYRCTDFLGGYDPQVYASVYGRGWINAGYQFPESVMVNNGFQITVDGMTDADGNMMTPGYPGGDTFTADCATVSFEVVSAREINGRYK